VRFARLTASSSAAAHELLAEVRPRERAPAGRPFVYVNFVASVDGRATVDGRAGPLGRPGDLEMLLELRALADAVLIGAATLRAESYARLLGREERRARREAAGLPGDPLAVIVSQSGDVPWEAGLFQAPEQPVLVYADAVAPSLPAPVEVVPARPLPEVMADLRARGIRALGSEGGPRLLRSLVEAGLIDELFLTLTPVLTGDPDAIRIVEGAELPTHASLGLEWVLELDGELFLRYSVGARPLRHP
jgi:riboflavin biosynthesis pyrimidine reductase